MIVLVWIHRFLWF